MAEALGSDIEHKYAVGYMYMENGKRVPFKDPVELNIRMREFLDDYIFRFYDLSNCPSLNVELLPNKDGSPLDLSPYFGSFLVGARDYFFASEDDDQCFIGQNDPYDHARIFYELDLMPRAQKLWPFERCAV